MSYGSLKQDEVLRNFVVMDDDLDIIEFPKECEGDIENQLKNMSPSFGTKNSEIIYNMTIHNEPARGYIQPIARSYRPNYAPHSMTICGNIELTATQMVILFITTIFFEYCILLVIIH